MTQLRTIINGNTTDASDVNQYRSLYRGAREFDLINGYGCDPTGVTECSTLVNQAFTDAAASGGSAVVTGYGTLKVNAVIKCASDNVALIGQGAGHPDHMLNGLCFKAQAAFPGGRILDFSQSGTPTKPLSGNLIANVAVDGNAMTGTAVDGIYFSVHDGLMDFCHVAYCSGWGVHVQGVGTWTTYNTLVRTTRAHNCNSGGFFFDAISTDSHDSECWSYYNGLAGGSGSTVNNANADGMQIQGSGHQSYGYHAYSNTAHGVDAFGTVACQTTGAYLENNGKAGFYTDNTVSGASGYRLTNSYIWANGTATNNTWDNVQIAPSGAHGTSVIVTGNHISAGTNVNKPRYGVNLTGSGAQNCLVDDNLIVGTYGTGPLHSNGSSANGIACWVYANQGYNPVGKVTAPAVAASVLASSYPSNEAYTVYMTGTASTNITAISVGGNAIGFTLVGATQISFRILPGQDTVLTGTLTGAAWTWFAD